MTEKDWPLEIRTWQNGGTNFTSLLFTLMQKADRVNFEKLRTSFPDEALALESWMQSDDGLGEDGS